MGKHEIQITLTLAEHYLDPHYNPKDDLKAQKEKEEGVFNQVVSELAKKDQDVLKIWKIVQKKKREERL